MRSVEPSVNADLDPSHSPSNAFPLENISWTRRHLNVPAYPRDEETSGTTYTVQVAALRSRCFGQGN